MAKKYIYVKEGEEIKIEVVSTIEGKSILVMGVGHAQFVDEVQVGDAVYTVDEAKKKFPKFGIAERVYSVVRALLDDDEDLPSLKSIALIVNDELDGFLHIKQRTIANVLRDLGLDPFQTEEGYFVTLDEKKLETAFQRFQD